MPLGIKMTDLEEFFPLTTILLGIQWGGGFSEYLKFYKTPNFKQYTRGGGAGYTRDQ